MTPLPIPRHIQHRQPPLTPLPIFPAHGKEVHTARPPRLARRVADLPAHERVEQRGFPDIRASEEGDFGERRDVDIAEGGGGEEEGGGGGLVEF